MSRKTASVPIRKLLLAAGLTLTSAAHAQGSKAPYARMAPIAEYLMSRKR